MKLTTLFGLMAFQLLSVSALPTDRAPDAETTIVERQDMTYPVNPLQKRACWKGKSAGCTNGYCWRRCGNSADYNAGHWCWLAHGKDGKGDWLTCRGDQAAGDRYCQRMALNKEYYACGAGNCKDCGCSCFN